MIEVRKLSKNFNGKPVLEGIDLDINDNETLVILGPSGQGKTVGQGIGEYGQVR